MSEQATTMTLDDLKKNEVYTPVQIAQALKVKPRFIADAFRDGKLAGIALGPRTIRITGQAVLEWLESRNSHTNLGSSAGQIKTSPTGSGASTSSVLEKPVRDLVLASL